MYYDLCVHEEINISEKTVSFLKYMGWNGVGIIKRIESVEQARNFKKESFLKEIEEFKIFSGVEIKAESVKELKKIIKEVREKVLILLVYGGDYSINRAACEDSRIDVLLHPELGRKDNGLDEYCIKKAKENEVAIGISFRHVLQAHGKQRVLLLKNIAENIRLSQEIGANVIACSSAKTIWDVRDPRALASFLNVLGLELGKAIKAVAEIPEKIVVKNEKILSGTMPIKGVEVVENEG